VRKPRPTCATAGTLIERGDAAYDDAHMSDFNRTTDMTPRRGFLRRVGSAAALGLAGLVPGALHAQPTPTRSDGPNWPGMKGRHRQVVDACEVNSGFLLAFAYTVLAPNESATAASFCVMARFRSRSATRCGPNTKSAKRSRSPIRKRRRRR
jgi:hypothetical protein